MSHSSRTISLTKTVCLSNGESQFEDSTVVLNSGDPDDPPLAKSSIIPATAISFRWTPGDYVFDFHPAPRRRVIILLEGQLDVDVSSGERRRFTVGDVLEVGDIAGKGHVSNAVDGRAFRSAIINLDDTLVTARTKPIEVPVQPDGIDYLRTFDDVDGQSDTTAARLPYLQRGPSGYVTDEVPIMGFQFVLAPPDLDYNWHRAPQRQFVIPITGGMEVENGKGARHKVLPGEIYVGEDVSGQGHITRAIDGCERLSIFAHLAGSIAN